MLAQQTRIECRQNDMVESAYIDKAVYQATTTKLPWAVALSGYRYGSMDVTIYHEQISDRVNNRMCYRNLRFDSASAFVGFIERQLRLMRDTFGYSIEIKPSDLVSLRDAFLD